VATVQSVFLDNRKRKVATPNAHSRALFNQE